MSELSTQTGWRPFLPGDLIRVRTQSLYLYSAPDDAGFAAASELAEGDHLLIVSDGPLTGDSQRRWHFVLHSACVRCGWVQIVDRYNPLDFEKLA